MNKCDILLLSKYSIGTKGSRVLLLLKIRNNIINFLLKIKGENKKHNSVMYKATTLGTTQKRSSWTSGGLIKHLYKTTANQICSF